MLSRNLLLFMVILSIMLLCFSGCGSSSGGGGGSQGGSSGSQSGNKGTILITAPFPAKAAAAEAAKTNTAVKPDKKTIRASRFIPLTVYIYVVTVCEQGTTTAVVSPVNINRPDSGNTVDASVDDVPVGWKTVRVFAYDSNRNLLAQGASDVEVKSADQGSTEASVTLASTSDPPSVSSTTPSNAQISVSINTKVTVLFSMSMLASSLSTDTFYLQSSQGKVEGAVTTDGSTAIFTPSSALLPLTTYTAVISGNVKNTAGLSMGTDYTWSFTTGEKPDTTPPQVKETSPVSGAASIDTGATISAVFTKNIDPATVTSSTFTVTSSKAAVSGTISTLGNSVTFVPATALQTGAAITVTLSGIIKDLAGNAMGTDYTWNFTTKAPESGGGGGGGGSGCTCSWHKEIPKPTFETINDVYYVSATEAYAVGDDSVILKYDGSGWKPMNSPVSSVNLNSVRIFDSTHGYAVGSGGTVLFYDGSAWSNITLSVGVGTGITLWGIEGNSNSDFFIVGTSGTIWNYDGSTWNDMSVLISPPDFLGVFTDNATPANAVVVGTGGAIYHSVKLAVWGSFAQEATGLTSNTLTSVCGSTYKDLSIVGYSGTYIYNDSIVPNYQDYSSTTGASSHDLKGVWQHQVSGRLYAVGCGGLIIATTSPGTAWTSMSSGTANELRSLCGLNSATPDIFTVGYNGTALHFNGTAWSVSPGTTLDLNAVWADSSSGRAIAVGKSGAALEYSSGAWKCMNMGTAYNFIGVWGSSMSNAFAVADNTNAPVYYYDGSSWAYDSDITAGPVNLVAQDMWGRSASEVYVVGTTNSGADTQVYVTDGTSPGPHTWTLVGATISGFVGTGIWGPSTGSDIYICGTSPGSDRIYHSTGGSWTVVCNDGSISPIDLWGSSSSNIWSVGYSGNTINGNGSAWSVKTSGTTKDLKGVWGDSSSKFFAVGNSGTIVYYNGSSWSAQSSGVAVDLTGVHGIPNSNVFATGKTGTVLRYY
ncbi:MAG: Ig-like domain-containing protein [Candidatus Xenobiia bacterium LiM19]